ncbi:asparagine synthetase B [Alicyclobacillus cellulosilyticus]|uniref:asparagine synthase (glutamine-hydrolyzing) n=1 Tax=Alicyclobacillus cellulosilyticus TaxID=1003997 RepID=A0A917KFY9_9BACL|nr:asparagine synthase (glutamine-hydrolyzing) [Alicyclobacillus cellulosilyticus]GGJ11689.1 asparagine synthetase B [Alicyclobacillus cellulosilyticus]
MCGIAGWVDFSRDMAQEQAVVAAMGETLACRGPDASGCWCRGPVAFAHRRLVVVDPAGGAQPMIRRFGGRTYVIVYNGELYNTEEIRRDLIARGHTFQSYSDTEVLLHSYVEWGPACVDRCNGIFAFAVWDEAAQTLFLARDRLGVKPLFYSRQASGIIFGSEPKALLAHPGVSRRVDLAGLAEVFAIGPARTPGHGVFKDISELRAGHCLLATPAGVRIYPYWQLASRPHEDSLDTTVETVRALLVDAVERQLVSDVPVCTFLSGGLDSSAVSAIAARAFARDGKPPLHTFSIEFADMERYFQANNFQTSLDAPWARRVAAFLGTEHHAVVFDTPDLTEHLLTPLAARDVPGMADIDVSLYLFCREVKRHATVALSGESADEVFGGYPWFHREEALRADTFPWSLRLSDRVRILAPWLRERMQPEAYVRDRYQEALREVPRLPGEDPREARVREIAYLSLTRFLPTLLDRKDRMSMASGLEVRVPFCDHRLVEYVFNIPWAMKACDGQAKGILRRALRGWLPDDALARKKSPYPSTPHPGYLAAVRDGALAVLADPASPLRELVDVEAVQELAAMSRQPMEHRPWFGQIMGTAQLFHYLMEVDAWLRTYRVELDV